MAMAIAPDDAVRLVTVTASTKDTAQVLIGGPALVERALGEKLTKQELGGARVHARSGVVTEQIAPNKLRVNPGGCVDYRVGDRLQLYDPDRGVVRAESLVVTEVEQLAWQVIVTIDPPFDGITTGTSFADADHLFNLDACGAGAVIRNNVFGNHRGRGLLLKSTDCLVENNVFRNREGWAISFTQLQGWGEGPAAQRIMIRDNTFEGQGAPSGYASKKAPSSVNRGWRLCMLSVGY